MSEKTTTASQEVFGVPGYTVKVEKSVGGMVLVRPDWTSVCVFEGSVPESAIKRIAHQDQKVQGLWRESLAYLMIDPAKYIDYKAALDGEIAVLRRLVHGGAIAEQFTSQAQPRRGQPGARTGR